MPKLRSKRQFRWPLWLAAMATVCLTNARPALAQQPGPVGQFLTLNSPVTDEAIGRVRRVALALQDQAAREGREGVLVLEITPGASQFHHVYALADFLASPAVAGLRTVAWVPDTVTGNNVLLALTCREIVAGPDVSLGDMGRGEALSHDQMVVVKELVGRGGNRLVTPAIAAAMGDPQTELRQLTVTTKEGQTERRLVTAEQARDLAASGAMISESKVIKERGSVGLFSSAEARAGGFLITQMADSRHAVAERYRLSPESMRQQSRQELERVSLIEIRGPIDTMLASFIQRQITRAVESDTQMIVFEAHSPTGQLTEARDLAMTIAHLSEQGIRAIAWVPESATGAPAMLALACDEIYLSPQAKLGAIGRRRDFREINFGDIEDADPAGELEQEQQFLKDNLRELAELKHRPAAILQAMGDPKLLVFQATNRTTGEVTFLTDEELDQRSEEFLRGPVVAESGRGLLTVSGLRAQQLMVAEPPVDTFDDMRHRLGLPDSLSTRRIEKTWVDELVFMLNRRAVTGLLFVVAIVCIYVELHTMTGLLGLLSLICFALFFWSRFLGGTAGGLEILLFLIGLGALAMEIFVLPGFGLFGVTGSAMVLASLVMASQTFGNIESGRDFSKVKETLTTLSYSIVTVIAIAALLGKFLPRLPFLNEMVLTPPGYQGVDSEPRLASERTSAKSPLLGARGTAETMLRPAGKATIQGRLMNVSSDGPFIPAGRVVEVVQVTGNHVVVREA
ncbi:MAG: NfeD family protein [Planctomycetaceae bacterium]